MGSIDCLLPCTCQRALPLSRSRPRLRHPSIRTVRFCTSPVGPQIRADSLEEEEAIKTVATPDQLPKASSVPSSEEWELDFSSRPLVDERGKKIWELVICSPDRSFEYTEYFPNNKINSKAVRLLTPSIRHCEGHM